MLEWVGILLLTLGGAQPHAQQSVPRDTAAKSNAPAEIIGRITSADGREGIRNARVCLVQENGEELDPVLTDGRGQFRLTDVPPGAYTLAVTKAGYVATRYGARRALDPAVVLHLESGIRVGPLTVPVARGAAVSGHVLNDFGEPLIDAAVSTGMIEHGAGGAKFVTVRTTRTDDLGEYRVGDLPAGSYIVYVRPNVDARLGDNAFAMGIIGEDGSHGAPTYQRTYYPSTPTLTQAQRIVLEEGREVAGVDVTFRVVPAPRLTLHVSDPSGAAARGRFTMFSRGEMRDIGRTGTFDGWLRMRVDPGDWVLLLYGMPSGIAMVPFTVQEEDVYRTAVLSSGASVSGKLVAVGSEPLRNRVQIRAAIPDAGMFPGTGAAEVAADGTFRLDHLVGPVILDVRNLPRGWVARSLTVNGRDLLDVPLEFTGTDQITGAELRVTNTLAHLSGAVSDAAGNAVSNCVVLVYPSDPARLRNPSRWARWIRTDASGRFSADLLASEYLVVALFDADETQWTTAEYAGRVGVHATSITLQEGERRAVSLTIAGQER